MLRTHLAPRILVAAIAVVGALPTAAQPQEIDLQAIAAAWPDMSAADFVEEVVASRAERGNWEPSLLENYRIAVYQEAARRLTSSTEFAAEDLPALPSLAEWASEVLTPEAQQQVRDRLVSQVKNKNDASFAEMQAAYRAQAALLGSREDRTIFAKDWLVAQDRNQLSNDQLLWCAMAMRPRRDGAKAGFSATWTGQITPPRDGEYVFSICPLAISTEFGSTFYRQWMTVDINGQRVVDASPAAWDWEGTPIVLSGGQAVPIRVTFRYEKNAIWRLAPAILSWQGPGFARSIVPPTVLKQPGEEAGLVAEYRWNEGDAEQVRTLVEPNVDCAWTEAGLAGEHTSLMRTVVGELFDRVTAAEYLAQYGPDGLSTIDGQPHPLFHTGSSNYCRALTYATTPQRSQWIRRLIGSPQVLVAAEAPHVARLYSWVRAGCEREAVDLLGTWMQGHADLEPNLASSSADFYRANRVWFRDFTIGLVWEHPPSIGWLEADYLEDPQGDCVLPAAYTLAYAYWVQGNDYEWTEFLDAKLAEPELTGDRRVNWLIARAMAEEIHRGSGNRRFMRFEIGRNPTRRHFIGHERLGAGREWLEEAALVAESPATRLRITKERISRLTAMRQWTAAEAELEAAPVELTEWGQELVALQDEVAARAEQQEKASQEAFIAELERRLAMAQERQDPTEIERYQRFIDSAKLDPSE